MKKLFLSLIFVIGCVISYSQDSIKIPMSDSGKLTLNKVYEDAKAGTIGLAKALKTPVEHVYKVIVKQQVVVSIINVLLYVLGLILVIFSFFKSSTYIGYTLNKDHSWYRDDWEDHALIIIWGFITIVFTIILFISVCASIASTITGFVNPEYGAIKDIISFVKQ